MSDDEYYDDEDDWYWYEEDYSGIGDDLAATAVHSPIMVEDPSLEIVETFSDWEYYSDDYYDDDPSITKKQGTESGNAEGPRKKKRKKRKLSSVPSKEVPALSLGPAIVDDDENDDTSSSGPTDATSFKGVLWRPALKKQEEEEEVALYEPGMGEKVAFFSDWREVFKSSLIRSDWFHHNNNGENHDQNRIVREITPERIEVDLPGERYVTYSPPPLEIDDMNKSIGRQREKRNIQADLRPPQSGLREMTVIGDSQGEEEEKAEEAAEEIEESAAPKEDEKMLDQEQEEQEQEQEREKENDEEEEEERGKEREREAKRTTSKKMLRVEVPAPSNVPAAAPRKRGRKPKDESTSTTSKVPNPKKRSLQADDIEEPDSKRRSRRIASVSDNQPSPKAPTKSNRGRKKKTV